MGDWFEDGDINGFLLSNHTSTETGIDGAVLWISSGEFVLGTNLDPRIIVVVGPLNTPLEHIRNSPTISISKPPKVMQPGLPAAIEKQAINFVSINYRLLLAYWNQEIDTPTLCKELKKNN